MCGIAGYVGLYSESSQRKDLVEALGYGIDTRGGHASGYVSVTESGRVQRIGRRIGQWREAKPRFVEAAAKGSSAMLHARWSTIGNPKNIMNAHPFRIERDNETKLIGCHNGVLHGTFESARSNNRPHSVDSKEFFELLADKDYNGIRKLSGYGVVTWTVPGDESIRLLRLSHNSDVVVYRLTNGGIVWASTKEIAETGIEYAGLEIYSEIRVPAIGTVYRIEPGNVKKTKLDDIRVNGSVSWHGWGSNPYGDDYEDYHYTGRHNPTIPMWEKKPDGTWSKAEWEKNPDGTWVKVDESSSTNDVDRGWDDADNLKSNGYHSFPSTPRYVESKEDREQREQWEKFFNDHPEFTEKDNETC